MKIYKKISLILAISLVISSISTIRTEAFIFEEDNTEDEMINIEELEINDVDINNLLFDNPRVSARNAIAIDGTTKQILYEQNAYEVVAMASTTKILTALVAIKHGDLDREFEISKKASGIRGSTVGYRAGEKIALRELLFGLMFKSGNDAAIAIAEGIGGSVENFANIMNDYGRSLGLTTSHYESPHGLDSAKHHSSAYDLAILTAKAMENDFFREICGEKSISKDKYNFTREYSNINKILWKIPNANGVKTGYTGQAGKCLVSSIRYQDRDIIIVVLNCSDRWNVTEKIFKHVAATYTFDVKNKDQILESSGVAKLGSLIEDCEFQCGFKEEANLEVEVFSPIDDLEKGDIIGKLSLKTNGNEKLKKSLVSKRQIQKEELEKIILDLQEDIS